MENARIYRVSAQITAQILNLHWGREDCKAAIFFDINKLIYFAMTLAAAELREEMLEPSDN